jgi:Zn-dependent alcohol dehydrogenase
LSIEEIEFRDKLSPGQVLVKIERTAICGSQIGEIDAVKGPDPHLPHLLGHEAVALVVDSGTSTKCKDGDQVILHWIKCEGLDALTPKYFSSSGPINAGQIATFGEYAVVSENRLTVIQKCDPHMLNAFATIGCALLTAFGTINRIIGDQKLNNVLVLGGGGLGQAAVIVLRNFHETSITVVEPNATKAEYCKKLGAKTSLLSANQIDVNDNFSSAIETTGVPSVIEKAFEAIDSKGIIALIGVTKADQKITINPMPLHYGKQIVGIYGGNANPKEDIPLLKEALITSKTLKHLQFSEFELNGINDALRDMRLGKIIGRAILVMES